MLRILTDFSVSKYYSHYWIAKLFHGTTKGWADGAAGLDFTLDRNISHNRIACNIIRIGRIYLSFNLFDNCTIDGKLRWSN